MMRKPPQRIDVTIDRLVLRGFAPGARNAVAAALAMELRRQLNDPAFAGRFGASGSLASLRAKPMTLQADTKPQHVGEQAARRLARSIRP